MQMQNRKNGKFRCARMVKVIELTLDNILFKWTLVVTNEMKRNTTGCLLEFRDKISEGLFCSMLPQRKNFLKEKNSSETILKCPEN